MPIQQVIASIAVQVQNSQALQNLANGYRAVGQAASAAQNNMNQFSQNAQNANRQATAFTGSIAKLTQSMVLFSVLLPVVRLPQTAIKSFQDMVDVGTEWEHQIRSINSLLALNEQGYQQLNAQMKQLAVTYGLTTDEIGNAGKQIASTLGVIQRNTAGMTDAQRAQDDYNTSIAMMDKVAKLSRASFEDMNTVTEAAFSIMATGRLTLGQADDAFNELFKTVQIGRSTFAQFNQDAGKFIPLAEDWIQTADNATDRFSRLTGVLNVFATASNSLGSARAATGVGRMFQAIAGTSTQQQQMIAQLENFRRRMGLGQEYNITPQSLFATGDTQDIIQRLWNVLGPQSPIISQQIENMRRRGRLQDEGAAREALAQQLQKKYFEQVQAVRAFQATTPGALAEMGRAREAAPGEEAAYQQYLKDPLSAIQRMNSAWTTLKDSVFEGIARDVVRLNVGFSQLFEEINKGLSSDAMQGTGLGERLKYIYQQISDAFVKWYSSGGKQQIADFGLMAGRTLSQGIADFFSGDDGKNMAADAAKTFLMNFAEGIKDNFPQMVGEVMNSSLTRAIATFLVARRLGVPLAPAIGLGAGTTGLPSGGGASGAATAGLLGAAALWPMLGLGGGRTGVSAMGSAASAIGNIFRGGGGAAGGGGGGVAAAVARAGGAAALAAQLGVSPRTVQRWAAGTQTPSPANAAAIAAFLGGGGGGGRVATALGSTLSRGNLALTGVATALGLYSALTGPEQERGRGIGSAVGTAIGGLGGAFLGSLVAPGLGTFLGGAGGSILGGQLGGMAGDWVQQNLFGAPKLATAGSGLGPGTETADDLTAIFALGMNNSDAVIQLEQINRKMDRNAGALSGTAVKSATSKAGLGSAGTGQPGAAGSLEGAFVDQYGGQLTKAQADAACGPAAVAFFAKAYGRNPTLAEAYALQSQLQGADIATTGGSNIVQMGAAIQKLGAPAGEVYQGANIDWGRLAENAKQGIPGIVNIGPNSKTGWPGHFFQMGGYNPDNNTFMVGSSGTNLKGGSAWMTPQQMMAFGPAFGAIYGQAATNLGGGRTPGVNIQGSGAVGSGRGDFLAGMIPLAKQLEQQTGIPWQVTTAIAANETGYGSSNLAKTHFNFFGMQGSGAGGDRWAQYGSAAESVDAFGKLISGGGRYATAFAKGKAGDAGGMVQAMKDAGYIVDEPGFPAQAWVNQVQGIMQGLPSGAGPGGGGGAIQVNGNLIGTVVLGGGASQDDADALAAMIADALENLMNTSGGGTVGQNKMFKQ